MSNKLITLAHGGGGKTSARLVKEHLLSRLGNSILDQLSDAAILQIPADEIAFTTDSYVVSPWRFPGGDIGKLAVCGTVNDLAVMGARPAWLTLGMIIEEGFSLEHFDEVVDSIARTASDAGVKIVAGDTKVVPHGQADGIYLNTAGIGVFDENHRRFSIPPKVGDKLFITSALADHGLAVMAVRENLPLTTPLTSDCAPLNGLVETLREAGAVRWLRDCTRGGLASAANELAESCKLGLRLDEESLIVHDATRAISELLGLDILHVANEGLLLGVVSADDAQAVLQAARSHPYGSEAALIGEITADNSGRVIMETAIGGERIVDMLIGEQLPRIC